MSRIGKHIKSWFLIPKLGTLHNTKVSLGCAFVSRFEGGWEVLYGTVMDPKNKRELCSQGKMYTVNYKFNTEQTFHIL